jgi:hypothetical protein
MNAWLLAAAVAVPAAPSAVDDFTLRDHRGVEWRLAEHREPIVVLVFLGSD